MLNNSCSYNSSDVRKKGQKRRGLQGKKRIYIQMFFVERREPGIKILLNKHNRKNNKKEEKIFAVEESCNFTKRKYL